jgi:hypothetical protein
VSRCALCSYCAASQPVRKLPAETMFGPPNAYHTVTPKPSRRCMALPANESRGHEPSLISSLYSGFRVERPMIFCWALPREFRD